MVKRQRQRLESLRSLVEVGLRALLFAACGRGEPAAMCRESAMPWICGIALEPVDEGARLLEVAEVSKRFDGIRQQRRYCESCVGEWGPCAWVGRD